MKKVTQGIMMALTLTVAALATTATTARADTVSTSATRYTVEAECSGGNKDVLILNWSGYGLAMYVYQNGRLIKSGAATKSVIESSPMMKRVSYATGGSVVSGGVNLRIVARHTEFPELSGTGHVTMRGSNTRVDCSLR